MGKKIDRLMGFILLVILLFSLFMNVFGRIWVACLAVFAVCALLHRLRLRRTGQERMSARDAQSILRRWIYGDEGAARAEIRRLLLQPDDDALFCHLRPPAIPMSKGDVFNAWRSRQGRDRLLIAATCYADAQARVLAGTLKHPTVEIIDAGRLLRLVRRSSLTPAPRPPLDELWQRLRLAFAALPDRYSWRKCALYGGGIMALYLFTGAPFYLVLSMGALFLAGVSLRWHRL